MKGIRIAPLLFRNAPGLLDTSTEEVGVYVGAGDKAVWEAEPTELPMLDGTLLSSAIFYAVVWKVLP